MLKIGNANVDTIIESLNNTTKKIQEAIFLYDIENGLSKFGISIKDKDNTYRRWGDIIDEVSKIWNDLEEKENLEIEKPPITMLADKFNRKFRTIDERLKMLEDNKVEQSETYEFSQRVANAIRNINNQIDKQSKLEELCKPISDYLRDNYCPYDSVVITDNKIRLVRDEIGIPVDRNRDSEEEATIGSQLAKLVVLSGDLGENPYGSKYEAELARDNFIVGLVGNRNKELFKSLLSEFDSKTK